MIDDDCLGLVMVWGCLVVPFFRIGILDGAEVKVEDVPHYALPNFAHILPEYTNSETDYIKSAFRTITGFELRSHAIAAPFVILK